ncbi:MAG: hypothetical protein IPK78_16345 [Rhodospirillales bacterium]|nr:hypothetical protein [Rhodospirillales bacterium]
MEKAATIRCYERTISARLTWRSARADAESPAPGNMPKSASAQIDCRALSLLAALQVELHLLAFDQRSQV